MSKQAVAYVKDLDPVAERVFPPPAALTRAPSSFWKDEQPEIMGLRPADAGILSPAGRVRLEANN